MSRAAFMRAMESMPSFRTLMFAYVEAFLENVNWEILEERFKDSAERTAPTRK